MRAKSPNSIKIKLVFLILGKILLGFLFILGIIGIILLLGVAFIIAEGDQSPLYGALKILLVWLFGLGILPMILLWVIESMKPIEIFRKKLSKDLEKINTITTLTENYVENFDEILATSHSIYKDLRAINPKLKGSIIFTKNTNSNIIKLRNTVYENIISKLVELRGDLAKSIENQKSITKEAGLYLGEKIVGNNNLNQVSELQRQRLDQQIAQFEKLQRVLVKV